MPTFVLAQSIGESCFRLEEINAASCSKIGDLTLSTCEKQTLKHLNLSRTSTSDKVWVPNLVPPKMLSDLRV